MNIEKEILKEIEIMTEKEKENILNYVKSIKKTTKGINPFNGFCQDDPELLDKVLDDVENFQKMRYLKAMSGTKNE